MVSRAVTYQPKRMASCQYRNWIQWIRWIHWIHLIQYSLIMPPIQQSYFQFGFSRQFEEITLIEGQVYIFLHSF